MPAVASRALTFAGSVCLLLMCLPLLSPSEARAGSHWGDYVVGAGMLAATPAAGLTGDLGGRTGPLRSSLELGLWVRGTDGGPRAFDGPRPAASLAGTTAIELGLELWLGHKATLGPVGAIDLAWLPTLENRCGQGIGCRYPRSLQLGAVTAAWEPAVGLAWNTNARTPADKGFELSVLLEMSSRYDTAVPLPRTEVAWRPGRNWIIAVELTAFEATARVGKRY